MQDTPLSVIEQMEQAYINDDTQISEYVQFSLQDNVNKIEAYLNSKHISGSTDSLGREKPFFNISVAAANVWYRATDIDRANIRIKAAKKSQHTLAMIANIHLKQWMRKAKFGVFLNEWGRTLSRYGSAVVKFIEVNGELKASVVPWNRLILDSVEFDGNPVIEKHYYTVAQMRNNKAFNKETIEQLLTARETRKNLDKQTKDNKADYIEVYELHGEFPLSWLTDNESDEETYVQQVHMISKIKDKDDKDVTFSLYSGREKNPYMITHLIKEDGRVMAIGAVEHLFEAQWMVNHNEKAIKDQLDLASKLIFQTSDPAYNGKNTHLLDTGSILYHELNQPLTQLANNSHDIASLSNSATNWRVNGNEIVSTPDAIKGNTMPSQTAARQVEALQQESHSLFELMVENKGLDIEEMIRRFVIPYIKKKMDTTEEITAVLDEQNIKEIDAIYVPNAIKRRINEKFKADLKKMLQTPVTAQNVEFPTLNDPAVEQQQMVEEMRLQGNQRTFAPSDIDSKTWKEALKDFEWDVDVEVTSEAHDKQSTLTTLTTVLREIAAMGDSQNATMILHKILEETGVFSPMELIVSPIQPAQVSSTINPEDLASAESNQETTQAPLNPV